MSDVDEFHPIPVYIKNPEELAKTNYPQFTTAYFTVTLESINTAETLIAASDSRYCALIFNIDDDVVIDANRSDAAKGIGAVIKQNLLRAPWPIYDNGTVYVAAPVIAGGTSRVSVMDIHYADKKR